MVSVTPEEALRDHDRLVPWVWNREGFARRVPGLTAEDVEDFHQLGRLGLMRAAERYDPSVGRFSTYAVPAIRYAFVAELEHRARQKRAGEQRTVSLSTPLPDSDGDLTLEDALASSLTVETEGDAELLERLRATADLLPERQRAVILARLDGRRGGDIAREHGLSPARVHQLINDATDRLRWLLAREDART